MKEYIEENAPMIAIFIGMALGIIAGIPIGRKQADDLYKEGHENNMRIVNATKRRVDSFIVSKTAEIDSVKAAMAERIRINELIIGQK